MDGGAFLPVVTRARVAEGKGPPKFSLAKRTLYFDLVNNDLFVGTANGPARVGGPRLVIEQGILKRRVDLLDVELDTATATLRAEFEEAIEVAVTATEAVATRTATLEGQVQTPGTGLLARMTTEETVRAAADVAQSGRTTTLEAQVKPKTNRIYNPSGGDGLTGWLPGTDWSVQTNARFGTWFFTNFAGAAGLSRFLYQVVQPVTPGQWTLSGRYSLNGLTAGAAQLQVIYWGASGYIGEAAIGLANGEGDLAPLTFNAPAGTTYVWVRAALIGASGAAGAFFGFWHLKLEEGAVATAFTDDATVATTAARMTTEETARATADTALAGRTTTLEGQVQTPGTGLLARMTTEESVRATADTALSNRSTRLEATASRTDFITANPFFSQNDFANGAAPVGWYGVSNLALTSRVAGKIGPNALRLACPGGVEIRMGADSPTNFPSPAGARWYVAEVVAELVSGSWKHNELDIQIYTAGFATLRKQVIVGYGVTPDEYGVVSVDGTVGKLTRFAILFEVTGGAITDRWQIIPRNGFARYFSGPAVACTVDIHEWGVRPATPTEIELRQARGAFGSVGARVTTTETATADLYTRTLARWAQGTAVPGASTFIYAQSENVPGSPPSSDVGIGAKIITLFNEAGGVWTKALEVKNGNATFTGGLSAGTFIRLGSGAGWPVALKPVDFNLTDGEVCSFGTDLGTLPVLTFAQNNLAPLSTGETYNLYADSLTATGFTFRAKINIPAAPTNQSVTTASSAVTISGFNGRKLARGALPDTADGTYRVTATGTQEAQIFGNGGSGFPVADNEVYVTTSLRVYALKSGVWTSVADLTVDTVFDPDAYPSGPNIVNEFWNLDEVVTVGTGASEIAVVVTGSSNGRGGIVNALTGIYWQSAGTASGVRSATPSGQKSKVTVRPQ